MYEQSRGRRASSFVAASSSKAEITSAQATDLKWHYSKRSDDLAPVDVIYSATNMRANQHTGPASVLHDVQMSQQCVENEGVIAEIFFHVCAERILVRRFNKSSSHTVARAHYRCELGGPQFSAI